MDLRRRLARLDRLTRKSPAAANADPSTVLGPSAEPRARLAVGLGLQPVGGTGSVYTRRRQEDLPPPDRGCADLAGLFTRPPEGDLTHGDLLFLDTETTGLAGGTGTLAFLVGLAWWEGRRLVVEQVLMTDPDGERDLLDRVSSAARGHRAVVTYNGAAFDLPLLRTRAICNRLRGLVDHLAGLDMVVPARRLWRRCLPDCRQQTLETHVCGLDARCADIPGRDIPAAWFAFLRGEDAGGMAGILEHNLLDMRGMAILWDRILGLRDVADAGPGTAGDAMAWTRCWSLARVALTRGHREVAGRWLRCAVDGWARDRSGHEVPDADATLSAFLRDGVRICKRLRDWKLLADLLAAGLAARPGDAGLHREAAILYEHRVRDLDTALMHALQCGEQRRVTRLRTRLDKQGQAERRGSS